MISGIQMSKMQSILKRKAEKLDDLIITYSTELKCFDCEQIPTPSKGQLISE
jgi:hypothetical protein